jgi:hypothetical protein
MGQFVTMISQGLYLFFVCPTPGYRVTILCATDWRADIDLSFAVAVLQ